MATDQEVKSLDNKNIQERDSDKGLTDVRRFVYNGSGIVKKGIYVLS